MSLGLNVLRNALRLNNKGQEQLARFSSDMQTPSMESIQAAILVADISGFTKLTESMGSKDSAGVEVLTRCINSFFGQVIDLVLQHGGDVMRFAGDSMICCFSASEEESLSPDEGLKKATLRSARCAMALVRELGRQPSPSTSKLLTRSQSSSSEQLASCTCHS